MLKKFLSLLFATCFIFGTVSAQSKDVEIDGDHGKLSAVVQTPDGKKNFPLVIICHGFTGNKNSDLLKNLAYGLENRGIASIRFDFNGHGDSEGNFQDIVTKNIKNVEN